MKEVSFSIPVSGVVRIEENTIKVTINSAETIVRFEPEAEPLKRISLGRGRTIFDLVLDAAKRVVTETGTNQFSAANLYHEAIERNPELRRNSFMSHVIACAPNHSSYKHYTSHRDYFRYLGRGKYSLNPGLLP